MNQRLALCLCPLLLACSDISGDALKLGDGGPQDALMAGAGGPMTGGNAGTTARPKPVFQGDALPLVALDILVMVDNTGSMREEQGILGQGIGALLEGLATLPRGLPTLHVGVVSSDVGAGGTFISGNPACSRPGGDRGELQMPPGCGVKGRFLVSLKGGVQANFDGRMEDVLSCMMQLGTQGCGYEHQLASVRAALDPSTGANSGFLRPEAHLLVLMLTDEDDCSGPTGSTLYADPAFPGQQASLRCALEGHLCNDRAVPGQVFSVPAQQCVAHPAPTRLIAVNQFIDDLAAVKDDPRKVFVAALTGAPPASGNYGIEMGEANLIDLSPACASVNGVAAPALRIKALIDALGSHGLLESICSDDYSAALTRISGMLKAGTR